MGLNFIIWHNLCFFFAMLKILFITVIAAVPLLSSAQMKYPMTSRWNVGLNVLPLIYGMPEVQAEGYFNKYFGGFGAAGYTLRYVPDLAGSNSGRYEPSKIYSMAGGYWKVGFKVRFITDKPVVVPWGQVLYIGSRYSEDGRRIAYMSNGNIENNYVQNVGVVHGLGLAHGLDFYIGKNLLLRSGLQVGYYNRNNHINYSKTYQPGFGATFAILPEQFMLGMMYRIGNVDRNKYKNKEEL